MMTYRQWVEAEYKMLRKDYPDAEPSDCRETAEGPSRRMDWVDYITKEMRKGTPTPQQWVVLKKDLGVDFIARRVFHDEPDSVERYLMAGLYLYPQQKGENALSDPPLAAASVVAPERRQVPRPPVL